MYKVFDFSILALSGVGAVTILSWVNTWLVSIMISIGNWNPDEAARAAPVIMFSVISGVSMMICGMINDRKK